MRSPKEQSCTCHNPSGARRTSAAPSVPPVGEGKENLTSPRSRAGSGSQTQPSSSPASRPHLERKKKAFILIYFPLPLPDLESKMLWGRAETSPAWHNSARGHRARAAAIRIRSTSAHSVFANTQQLPKTPSTHGASPSERRSVPFGDHQKYPTAVAASESTPISSPIRPYSLCPSREAVPDPIFIQEGWGFWGAQEGFIGGQISGLEPFDPKSSEKQSRSSPSSPNSREFLGTGPRSAA